MKYRRKRLIEELKLEEDFTLEEEKEKEIKYKRRRCEEVLIRNEFKQEEEDCWMDLVSLDTSLTSDIVKTWTIKMDEPYILSELLPSGTNRAYLVDRHGKTVSFDQLDRKYVLLYFWWLPYHNEPNLHIFKPEPEFNLDLEENYKLYWEKFEVVFVALDGTVMNAKAEPLFSGYGAHGFPFTGESIDTLLHECYALQYKIFMHKQMPSLTELLGEHVIFFPRDGEKVPTSKLDCKIVALYFFEPTTKGVQCTRQLLDVWNSLTDEQRDAFEIVIINKAPFNLYDALAEFKKKFGLDIPWYSVDVCGRKLCQVFERDSRDDVIMGTDGEGDLIVLQPNRYQHLSYFAFNILVKYQSNAYPFTLERAVELAKREQQNRLVLGHPLSPEAPLRRGVFLLSAVRKIVSILLFPRS